MPNKNKIINILSISDIHNNVKCVKKLVQQEKGPFDAVIIAGDIGSDAIENIMTELETYNCPIAYVLGNWDNKVVYSRKISKKSLHLHDNDLILGNYIISGFSGCESHWGQNPYGNFEDEILLRNINDLQKRMANKNNFYQVIVSHDRVYKIHEFFPHCSLHIFGHRHGFKLTQYKGVYNLNTSNLDKLNYFRSRDKPDIYKNGDCGFYGVISLQPNGEINIARRQLLVEDDLWEFFMDGGIIDQKYYDGDSV